MMIKGRVVVAVGAVDVVVVVGVTPRVAPMRLTQLRLRKQMMLRTRVKTPSVMGRGRARVRTAAAAAVVGATQIPVMPRTIHRTQLCGFVSRAHARVIPVRLRDRRDWKLRSSAVVKVARLVVDVRQS
jgi:hypothetical protein